MRLPVLLGRCVLDGDAARLLARPVGLALGHVHVLHNERQQDKRSDETAHSKCRSNAGVERCQLTSTPFSTLAVMLSGMASAQA